MKRMVGVAGVWLLPGTLLPAAEGWDGSALVGAGVEPFGYEVVEMFPGREFAGAVHVLPYRAGGKDRLLVSGVAGQLWSVREDGGEEVLVADLRERLEGGPGKLEHLRLMAPLLERGFPERRGLYVFMNVRFRGGEAENRLMWFGLDGVVPLALGEGRVLLSWPNRGHNGGELLWGPDDGMLYLSTGDRQAPGDPGNWGQRVDGFYGSVLRLDVGGVAAGGGCRVPGDNPFVGMEGVRPEIWAYGLRNPWRMVFHPVTGELWTGDNGDESWEHVRRVGRGTNHGWSAFEGSHPFRLGNVLGGPVTELTLPVVEHPHSEMRSVIGGLFYRGRAMPKLAGHYLYGGYVTKRIWAVSYDGGEVGKPVVAADAKGPVVAFAEGSDGEVIVTSHDGKLYRMREAGPRPGRKPWPATLGATGLFADVGGHVMAAGVTGYGTNAEAWSDGAVKERFLALPEGGKMRVAGGIDAHKSWELPEGGLVGQTLSLAGQRVETQLLYYDGTWRGFTYKWRADGREADLVVDGGEEVEVEVPDYGVQAWRFASRAECLVCHTQRTGFAVSLTTRQLERPGLDGEGNQVERFLEAGLVQPGGALKSQRGVVQVDPWDAGAGLGARARSYLDLNCAHCHRETGLGGRAGFELMAGLELEETGIVGAVPVVGLLGTAEARVVAAGDPEHSELLLRMGKRGAGGMPMLGSRVVDERGVALVREWILRLEGRRDVR